MLSFSYDNNAVIHNQNCYNLLTRLSNNDNNNEQACSINIVFILFQKPLTIVVASSMLNNIVETIVNMQHC